MPTPTPSPDDDSDYYERLQEQWPAERPSRKRKKRQYRRQKEREVVVRAERHDQPDVARVSRALLAARREFDKAQADAEARRESSQGQL